MNSTMKVKINKSFWKKIGIVGFLFFLIKGLVWIGVALFIWFKTIR
jgi:hypothetical protein